MNEIFLHKYLIRYGRPYGRVNTDGEKIDLGKKEVKCTYSKETYEISLWKTISPIGERIKNDE